MPPKYRSSRVLFKGRPVLWPPSSPPDDPTGEAEWRRDRICTLINGYADYWKSRGLEYQGSLIQTRHNDYPALLTESMERICGTRMKGAWKQADNQWLEYSNLEFLHLCLAIAHYAEECLKASDELKVAVRTYELPVLKEIPIENLEAAADWIASAVGWPSNVYADTPRPITLEQSPLVGPLVARINQLESLINPDIIPGSPNGLEATINIADKGSYFQVYLRLNNSSDKTVPLTGSTFVLEFDQQPYSSSGCGLRQNKNGQYLLDIIFYAGIKPKSKISPSIRFVDTGVKPTCKLIGHFLRTI